MLQSKARATFAALSQAIDEAAADHLKWNAEHILGIAQEIEEALAGRRYIAHSEALRLRELAAPHLFLLWSRPDAANADKILTTLKRIEAFHDGYEALRSDATTRFLASEPVACEDFFRTVESQPLSPMQMRAVLTDEDATLVLAGAGSGKTSVIVGKIAYLLHRNLRNPEEILALAYSRAAKEELELRLEKRVGLPVRASTFHALGLDIIGDCEARQPDVSVLSTDRAKLRRFIQDRLEAMLRDSPEHGARVVAWFTQYFVPYRGAEEFKTAGAYYNYLRAYSLRSLMGDQVQSHEECTIANFLFVNGIDYQYEAQYEHDTATSKRRQYKPDFKIGKQGLYVEHFGIDREGRTPTFIPEAEYTASMAWKRNLHRQRGTTLIETYSWQHREGLLLPLLERALREAGVVFRPLSPDEILEPLRRLRHVNRFSDLVATFLRHVRSTQLNIEELRAMAESRPDVARMRAFIDVFEPIHEAYARELALAGEIDFEDMIVRAARYTEEGRYPSCYRTIIVDEFQDISIARARLLEGLLRLDPLNRLFVVGDDWQSIYRFAGSDISVMWNFAEWFGHTDQVALDRTFRLGQMLSDRASDFVCRNPHQLSKKVTSDAARDGTAVTIIAKSDKVDISLRSALDMISKRTSGRRGSVQLLGRYNFNEPRNLSGLKRAFSNLEIEFLTIHRSKGLEADFVVVLDVIAGRYGFPSEIADDPVLTLVLAETEPFPNAEERRLFYVALTRAREGVYLLTRDPESAFLAELRGLPGVEEIPARRSSTSSCPQCKTGRLVERQGRWSRFLGCTNYPYCDHIQNLPPGAKELAVEPVPEEPLAVAAWPMALLDETDTEPEVPEEPLAVAAWPMALLNEPDTEPEVPEEIPVPDDNFDARDIVARIEELMEERDTLVDAVAEARAELEQADAAFEIAEAVVSGEIAVEEVEEFYDSEMELEEAEIAFSEAKIVLEEAEAALDSWEHGAEGQELDALEDLSAQE